MNFTRLSNLLARNKTSDNPKSSDFQYTNALYEYRVRSPNRFQYPSQNSSVMIEPLLEITEQRVIEGLIPINVYDVDPELIRYDFFSAIESFFLQPHEPHDGLEKVIDVLKWFLVSKQEEIERAGMPVEMIQGFLSSENYHKIPPPCVLIAVSYMLEKTIVLYECDNGIAVTYYKPSRFEVHPPNSIFLYLQRKEHENRFIPLRLINNQDNWEFTGKHVETVYVICDRVSFVNPFVEYNSTKELVEEIEQKKEAVRKSELAISNLSYKLKDERMCLKIIELLHQNLRQKNLESVDFMLTATEIQQLLSLVPIEFIRLTERGRLRNKAGFFGSAVLFDPANFSESAFKIGIVNRMFPTQPPGTFEVIKANGDGDCLFYSLSRFIFLSENYHSLLRLCTIIVVLNNYNRFDEAVKVHDVFTEPVYKTLLDLTTLKFPDNMENPPYPGCVAYMAASYLLQAYVGMVCESNGTETIVHYAYDLNYERHELGPNFLSYYNHTELIVSRRKLPFCGQFVVTINGLIDLNFVLPDNILNEQVDQIDQPVTEDQDHSAPHESQNNPDHFQLFKNRIIQHMSARDPGESIIFEAPFTYLTHPKLLHTKKELIVTKMYAESVVEGIALVTRHNAKIMDDKTLEECNAAISYRKLPEKERIDNIENPINKPMQGHKYASVWRVFQHPTEKPATFLDNIESYLALTQVTEPIRDFFGVCGSVFPLLRPSIPSNTIVHNIGKSELLVLHIKNSEIENLMQSFAKVGAHLSSIRNPISADSCDLFCRQGSLRITTDFLQMNNINYTQDIVKSGYCYISGLGGLVQVTCLGISQFQTKMICGPHFGILREPNNPFIHACKYNRNLQADITNSVRRFTTEFVEGLPHEPTTSCTETRTPPSSNLSVEDGKKSLKQQILDKVTKKPLPGLLKVYLCPHDGCVRRFTLEAAWIKHWRIECKHKLENQ